MTVLRTFLYLLKRGSPVAIIAVALVVGLVLASLRVVGLSRARSNGVPKPNAGARLLRAKLSVLVLAVGLLLATALIFYKSMVACGDCSP